MFVAAQLVCQSAQAQVLEPTRRPVRPPVGPAALQPDRARQDLRFAVDFLGGYDNNLAPVAGDSSEFSDRPSGYTGLSVARLDYTAARGARTFDAGGRTYMNTYRNVGLTPSYGGDVALRARLPLGRRTEAQVRQGVRYDPFLSLRAFDGLAADPDIQLPDSNPTTGIAENRSWTSDTAVSVGHRWTQWNRLDVDYSFQKSMYETPAGFDSRTHAAGVAYDRTFGRSTGLRASYRHSDVRSLDVENRPRPFQDHSADMGLRYGRDLSRTRRVSFTAGAGAVYVDTIRLLTRGELTYWAPSGYATAQLDLGQTWTINANYRRGVSMIEGSTPQPFVTDTESVTVGGFFASWADAILTAASSNGQTGGTDLLGGEFRNYALTGQLRFTITPWWSALAMYSRYRYKLDRTASLTLGVPPEMDRNVVRVGFSLTLPIVGRN